MKQCQPNPWVEVAKKYPPGTDITGIVRTLTNYGAFIEIEEGVRGLVHVTDLRWAPKVTHPSEVVQQGQKITCRVLSIDVDRSRIALGLKQMTEEETADIPIIWPHPDSQNLH